MGYKVLYDNQLLFDPYTDDRITDTKLSSKLNAASYFDFTIAPTHSLYSKLKERAGEVRIYFNNLILFKGEITKIDEDFEGNYSVSCTGVLDYLTATRVRPYSTVEGEQPLKAPSSFDGYFQWLIDQHNSNCLDSRKHFSVGVNQGNMLDKNNYVYRSSEQRPTTASEIEDKILNSNGGYLFVRYQDDLNILDLYADVHDVNTQIIDYGVNMLDFTKTTTTEGQYTAVVATGYTPNPPEGQTDAKMKPITLEGCTDGGTPYSSTIVKMGDRVYDVEAVKRYGYHEYYASNTDITTYDGLLYYACKTLNTLLSPALTISVKAVDLALIMGEKYKHLLLGQAVRIRSKPRKVDEYLMVNSIDLDLMNPDNTTFDLGASYDTLTGQQSAYLKSLNASINASLDTVSALGDNVKNSAKLAQEAKDNASYAVSKADSVTDLANSAVDKAEAATTKANDAKNTADEASTAAGTAQTKANEASDAANKAQDDVDAFKTDADAKYATKASLTKTASDLTINFNNKIDNINKYVRFVDGNVILGEAGNPITLKLTNDHLDILNNTDVVAKFAESAIELGNNSRQSEVKLCKGLGSIRGTVFGESDTDPIIEITTSSGVNLNAKREINAGHFTMGGFNVLTSSDGTNNETQMVSESYLRGDTSSTMKDAAISLYTSSKTGDSVCRISSSKIQINGYDAFRLTKLWSGNLSRGGSVNVIGGSNYTLFAVRPGLDGILMVGVKYLNQLHCYASADSGSSTSQYRASFEVNNSTFKLVAASNNILNGGNNAYTVTEIYGLF